MRAHLHGGLLDRRRSHRLAAHQRALPARVPQCGRGRDHVVQLRLRFRQRQDLRRPGGRRRTPRRFLDLRRRFPLRTPLRRVIRARDSRARTR